MSSNETTPKKVIEINMVFLGEKQSGKTALINRFLNDAPKNGVYKASVNKSEKLITVEAENKIYQIFLVDTSGKERCRSTISSFIHHSTVFIVVYDVTDVESFRVTSKWVDVIRSEHGDESIISLVGNKIERIEDRQISTKEGEELANNLKVGFIETSAISGPNVPILFKGVVSAILLCADSTHVHEKGDTCTIC